MSKNLMKSLGGIFSRQKSDEPKFNWSHYPYLLVLLIPMMPITGYILGFDLLFVVLTFVAMPIIDLLMGDNHEPFNFNQKQIKFIDSITFTYVIAHAFIVIFGSFLVFYNDASIGEILLFASLCGFATGGQGFPIGHEIGHSQKRWKRNGAKIIYMFQCYGQFSSEHNRGHHVKAATPEDVVYSPKNQSVYKFLPKAIIGSYISGTKLEAERLKKKGLSVWSLQNDVLTSFAGSAIIASGIGYFLGWQGLLFFFVQALFSIFTLEISEYIQHYGLTRKKLANGKYERMQPKHSWNAPQLFSGYLFLNLQRHPDHHANPGLEYHELRSHKEAPQLPTGYAGMIGLSLIPPFWFKVVNPILEKHLNKIENDDEEDEDIDSNADLTNVLV